LVANHLKNQKYIRHIDKKLVKRGMTITVKERNDRKIHGKYTRLDIFSKHHHFE